MDRRGFLKVMLAGAAAVVVPVGFSGTPAEALASHVELPVVDGYRVCLNSRTIIYTGESGNHTLAELFYLMQPQKGYECVGFLDPRLESHHGRKANGG